VKASGVWRIMVTAAASLVLVACGGGGSAPSAASTELSAAAALGKQIFSDASLSASGRQSCASCHDPDHAHGPTNSLAVQLGGANLDVPGFRAAPSLRYLKSTPAFFFDAEGTPTGGRSEERRVGKECRSRWPPYH